MFISLDFESQKFKGYLRESKIPRIKNESWCDPCKGSRREICKHILPTRNFTSFRSYFCNFLTIVKP